MTSGLIWDNEQYFPENTLYQCPPASASVYNGFLFRFCHQNTPCADDFKLVSSNPKFREKHDKNHELLCQSSGLSSFLSLADAEVNLLRLQKNSRGMGKKFKGIGQVMISVNDGKIMKTPSKNTINHHTWWKTRNSQASQNFSVVRTF